MGSYITGTKQEQKEMLAEIGFESMEELFGHIPDEVKVKDGLQIPDGMSELEVRRKVTKLAEKNKVFPVIFRGAGAYRHYIPATVKSVISKENLLTAYTPYQAEISQGILQSIFEYQTMICELTGMDTSNASVYDGGTAAAESIAMCRERKRKKALISEMTDPKVLETVKTYCFGNEMELVIVPQKDGVTDMDALRELIDDTTACVYIQHPNYYGNLEDAEAIGAVAHEAGAKYIMGVNPISLGVVKTPREYGADVAVGEGQPLGLPLAFGGPYVMAYDEVCMHEFVMSLSDLKKKTGVSAMDIAKGLLDNGIHPPTMYFPLIVDEALMVEPTETESKETLDKAIQVFRDLYEMAEQDAEKLHNAPVKTPVTRLDEVGAARHPVLKYEFSK